jgi:exodeoxyribonuclease III
VGRERAAEAEGRIGLMKIATWNVNSIKVRLPAVLDWLKTAAPDVLLLQEIKTTADQFPRLEIEAAGYRATVVGQAAYNGVAILSRTPVTDVIEALPGDPGDAQARYVEASIADLRIASAYVPNGNPVESDKFPYKLAWLERLARHAEVLLASERPLVIGGDYNVIPTALDAWDPAAWQDDALYRIESRRALRRLLNLGLTDAFRALHPDQPAAYTFWDYQAGRWQRGEGIRIDHLLLSPQAADRLTVCEIDERPRAQPRASDHTPIWCDLAPAPLGQRFT